MIYCKFWKIHWPKNVLWSLSTSYIERNFDRWYSCIFNSIVRRNTSFNIQFTLFSYSFCDSFKLTDNGYNVTDEKELNTVCLFLATFCTVLLFQMSKTAILEFCIKQKHVIKKSCLSVPIAMDNPRNNF